MKSAGKQQITVYGSCAEGVTLSGTQTADGLRLWRTPQVRRVPKVQRGNGHMKRCRRTWIRSAESLRQKDRGISFRDSDAVAVEITGIRRCF